MVNRILAVGTLIFVMFLIGEIGGIKKTVNYQLHIPVNDITLRMTDMAWDNLPPAIKEAISKNSSATKLSKKDLLELSKMYKELAETQKEPLSLKGISYGK